MIGFYTINDNIKDTLAAVGFNTVTIGDLEDVDINRQSIYPLALVVPQTVTRNGNVTLFQYQISGMDVSDWNKADNREMPDSTIGHSNVEDILQDILMKLSKFSETYISGDNFDLLFQALPNENYETFSNRFENVLTGLTLNITIQAPTGSVCL